MIINTGNTASLIKACQTPSVARGVALADDGAAGTSSQRFVLSGHASNAFFAKAMTFAAWVRAASDGATSRCLFSIIDGSKFFRIITIGTYSGANKGDYLAFQSYDGTRVVLDVRFPWTPVCCIMWSLRSTSQQRRPLQSAQSTALPLRLWRAR